jgi:N-methylhydantoinase A/oxoprolinase/acetone carboxylase beta subunit
LVLDVFSGENNPGRVDELSIRLFRLRATSPAAHPVLVTHAFAVESPEKALKGKREVWWKDGSSLTPVYRQPLLECGNVVTGPAVIESDDTVVLIPPGKKYTVDNLLNGVIESTR